MTTGFSAAPLLSGLTALSGVLIVERWGGTVR